MKIISNQIKSNTLVDIQAAFEYTNLQFHTRSTPQIKWCCVVYIGCLSVVVCWWPRVSQLKLDLQVKVIRREAFHPHSYTQPHNWWVHFTIQRLRDEDSKRTHWLLFILPFPHFSSGNLKQGYTFGPVVKNKLCTARLSELYYFFVFNIKTQNTITQCDHIGSFNAVHPGAVNLDFVSLIC